MSSWTQKKRNSISTSNHVLFCLIHMNMIALYWREKLTFTTNGNKKIQCIKSTCGKSSRSWFSFSATRNSITKATEYITFGFFFSHFVFSPYRKVWVSLSASNTDFSVFFQSEKILTDNLGLRMVAQKASNVSAANRQYQTHRRKYCIFSPVMLWLFSGLEILV